MEPKHSGLGIASFVMSILAGLGLFAAIVTAGIMAAARRGGLNPQSVEAVAVGLAILAFLGLEVVSLGLGIGGLCQQNRNKLFAILGTIFSSIAVVGTVAMIIFGNMQK